MNKEIQKIKRSARRMFRDVESVSHILPRAYCVAKPAPYYAVFAVPHQDREPQVKSHEWTAVQNESCARVLHGEWASLAYILRKNGTGEMYVINTTNQ